MSGLKVLNTLLLLIIVAVKMLIISIQYYFVQLLLLPLEITPITPGACAPDNDH